MNKKYQPYLMGVLLALIAIFSISFQPIYGAIIFLIAIFVFQKMEWI